MNEEELTLIAAWILYVVAALWVGSLAKVARTGLAREDKSF